MLGIVADDFDPAFVVVVQRADYRGVLPYRLVWHLGPLA